jgi:hypothetical protein
MANKGHATNLLATVCEEATPQTVILKCYYGIDILETKSKENLIQEIDALPAAIPEKFRLSAKSLLEKE